MGIYKRNRSSTMRKVCVVITARPSYSRIKTALSAIKEHPDLTLQLIVTSSAVLEKYGNVSNQIEKDGFEITHRLHNILEGNNPVVAVKTTGLALVELSSIFENLKPDLVVTIADRFETLATATAASYMNIPLVHIQGGEITGSIDDKVRNAVTQLSDIHFVASENAQERVIRSGKKASTVYKTGCPSIDIAFAISENPQLGFDPFEKYGGVGPRFDYNKDYLVVMQHPVTTEFNVSQDQINCTTQAIADLGIPTFWFWPNPDPGTDGISKGIRTFREFNENLPIHFFKNIESADFLRLLKNSRCLIGNSSVGIRECSALGVPVVNIGSRQLGRDRGRNVIDVNYDSKAIKSAIKNRLAHGHYFSDFIYGSGDSGEKIAELLAIVPLNSEAE